jgi:hypothetical protein
LVSASPTAPTAPTAPAALAALAAHAALASGGPAPTATRARTGRLLLLHESPTPEPETLAMLERDHAVMARAALHAPQGAVDGMDAVVLEVSHHTLDAALAMVQALARRIGGPPVLTFARFNVRSADRARLLHAGADDTLAGDMSAAELRHRLAAAIARGHVVPAAPSVPEPPVRQPLGDDGRPLLLDESRFAAALAAGAAHDATEPGSVVELVVDGEAFDDLTQLVLRSMRAGAGDLAARVGDVLLVYLHGARRRDTSSFVERIRTDWSRRPRSPLRITVRPHQPGAASLRDAPSVVPA